MKADASPYTWGPEPLDGGQWRFRLWAPGQESLSLELRGEDRAMDAEGDGWFALEAEAEAGDAYRFVLPDGLRVPDPAARRQAGDVHAPSLVTDPVDAAFWEGRPWEEAVIYEMHVGTFTPEGTFRAAIERLDYVAEAGFTCIEIMPVAQFGGDRGWGYDGVLLYAPHPAYGSPDDLRALVAAAHERRLMVKLDVVYNHFGPDGNYLGAYAPDFFDESRETPWGAAIAYDKAPVRRFFIENALYWLREFGFDGFRFDAIDQIRDPAEPDILLEIAKEIRAAFPDRHIHTATEDQRNITRYHERDEGRVTHHTAEWNDDMHNAAHVIATGESDGYYADFAADPWRLFARSLAEGFAFQGETTLAGETRGEPSAHLPPAAFVDFLQNHDQTGNRAFGERLPALASAPMVEALTAILLLSPHIPLMFMGEEYGEQRPFCFFADFGGDLGRAVTEGRRREFEAFAAFAEGTDAIPDPVDPATFEASKLNWEYAESDEAQVRLAFVKKLLEIRRTHLVPRLAGAGDHSGRILMAEEGAVAVDWQLDGATLQLRATLGNVARPTPPIRGGIINRTGMDGIAPVVVHALDVTG